MRVSFGMVCGAALLSVGCGRAHVSPAFGLANREAYAMQQAGGAKGQAPSMALDTQEAAAISGSYLKALAGKSATAEPAPVLLVAPQRPGQGQQQQPLAPSVPKQ